MKASERKSFLSLAEELGCVKGEGREGGREGGRER